MGWKYGVYGGGTGNSKENPAFNAVVYPTKEEAEAGGSELLSRWFAPSDFVVVEVMEEANYRFDFESYRPMPIKKEEI